MDWAEKQAKARLYFLAETPQEGVLQASSDEIYVKKESDWYKPKGLITGELTLEQARALRKEKGFFGINVGIRDFRRQTALSLNDLDENGLTVEDPKVLGEWDGEKLDPHEGRDWNTEFREQLKSYTGDDFHLREPKPGVESDTSGGIEER